jgi:hypothetical protein
MLQVSVAQQASIAAVLAHPWLAVDVQGSLDFAIPVLQPTGTTPASPLPSAAAAAAGKAFARAQLHFCPRGADGQARPRRAGGGCGRGQCGGEAAAGAVVDAAGRAGRGAAVGARRLERAVDALGRWQLDGRAQLTVH